MSEIRIHDKFSVTREYNNWIAKQGYTPCNSEGNANYHLHHVAIHFLAPNKPQPTTRWSWMFAGQKQRRNFIATLIVNDPALHHEELQLQVRGRDNLAEMTILARKIRDEFKKDVTVILISEENVPEEYDYDHDGT